MNIGKGRAVLGDVNLDLVAVALANRIDAVRAIEGDADKIAERDLELETLTADAAKLAKKIDFEKSVAESAKNLRSVVDRCSPSRAKMVWPS